jgi:hypothetical protein
VIRQVIDGWLMWIKESLLWWAPRINTSGIHGSARLKAEG